MKINITPINTIVKGINFIYKVTFFFSERIILYISSSLTEEEMNTFIKNRLNEEIKSICSFEIDRVDSGINENIYGLAKFSAFLRCIKLVKEKSIKFSTSEGFNFIGTISIEKYNKIMNILNN